MEKRLRGCSSLEHPATYHAAVILPRSGERSPDLRLWPEASGCLQESTSSPRRRLETTNRLPWRLLPPPHLLLLQLPEDPGWSRAAHLGYLSQEESERMLPESRIHGNRQAREDGGALMGGWGGRETSAKQHTSPLTLLTHKHTHTLRPVLWSVTFEKLRLSTNWRAESTANAHTHTWENTRKPPARTIVPALFPRCSNQQVHRDANTPTAPTS